MSLHRMRKKKYRSAVPSLLHAAKKVFGWRNMHCLLLSQVLWSPRTARCSGALAGLHLLAPTAFFFLFPTAQCKLKHLFLSLLIFLVVLQLGMKPCLCFRSASCSDSAFAPVHLVPCLPRSLLHKHLDSSFGPAGEGAAWKIGGGHDRQQENRPRNVLSPAKSFARQSRLLQHQ